MDPLMKVTIGSRKMIMMMTMMIMMTFMTIRMPNTQSLPWSGGLESDHHDDHHVNDDPSDDNDDNQDAEHPVLALE